MCIGSAEACQNGDLGAPAGSCIPQQILYEERRFTMHELPITESILEIAQRHAKQAGATRISDIFLVIGQLSSVIDDSVRFYWDMISEGTLAEGAQLHFRRVPAEFSCLDCQAGYQPEGEDFACPQCGSANVKLTAGGEFQVEAIEIDTAEPDEPAGG
jgi:hydrogenase nickel incorporation protein HypA/HybF